jgi:rhodanese-related sulfurtransferase
MVSSGKALLVDVREEHELRESGLAEGAQWMPMSKMDEDEPDWAAFKAALPKDKPIFLYCAAGARSGRVAEFLAQDGYQTVNIGGFKDWVRAGLPVKKF